MRLLILAAVAVLASFAPAQAQGPAQANCAIKAPQDLSLYFADNQTILTPQAQALLARAAQIAQACPAWTAVVTVYPGDTGSPDADQGVANRRLVAISDALAKLGVPAARLRLVTAGAPSGPAAPSVTGATIAFAAKPVPLIAHHIFAGPVPGGGVVEPLPIGGAKPPPKVEAYVGSLPKGPLVPSGGGGASAGPPPPANAVPPTPGPAPTPAPTQSSTPPPAQSSNLTVIYNAPPKIPLGQPTDYRLIIESARAAGAGDFEGAPGNTVTEPIPTVTLVRAVMTAPQDLATVQPLSDPCQKVSSLGNPSWNWSVTPKTNKPFFLTVDIYQVPTNCGDTGVQDVREDTFSISVNETFGSWLLYEWPAWKSAIAWVLATIAAAGGAFGAWTWIKSSRGSSASTQ